MRILILESSTLGAKVINMHVRNAEELQTSFIKTGHTCDLMSIASGGDKISNLLLPKVLSKTYDIVLVSYSSPYTHIDLAKKIIEKNPNAIYGWVTTDYEISPHGVFPFTFYISNFEEGHLKKKYTDYLMVNLNTLIVSKRNKPVAKVYYGIYYSRYRKDRVNYVKKYNHKDIFLSTSSKNKTKYLKDECRDYKFIDKLDWSHRRETLNLFRGSLYIEDIKTHSLYNHLGNRFYEGLKCNCPLYYDVSCLNTITKSGYPIDLDFIVDGPEDFLHKVKTMPQHKIDAQLALLSDHALRERAEVLAKINLFLEMLLTREHSKGLK